MSELTDDFSQIALDLNSIVSESKLEEIVEPLKSLESISELAAKSWSGSYLGYHSRVYYENLETPPPGAHFSAEWGLYNHFARETTGNWKECDYDSVRDTIVKEAGNPDLTKIKQLAQKARELFELKKVEINSLITTVLEKGSDIFLEKLQTEIEETSIFIATDYIKSLFPKVEMMTRDTLAASQGFRTPPHISVKAEVMGYRFAFQGCESLSKKVQQIINHLLRKERYVLPNSNMNKKRIFIGHGGSKTWKDLKDFLQDRLKLQWDEFNRVPIAGITNVTRLSQMLDDAGIAFLVLTAEDELSDGKMQARMNVIHEAGLFQGKLGFTRAIILLEEGCEEFSNIQGLGQLRFPKGNIKQIFEDVRQIVEREGILEA